MSRILGREVAAGRAQTLGRCITARGLRTAGLRVQHVLALVSWLVEWRMLRRFCGEDTERVSVVPCGEIANTGPVVRRYTHQGKRICRA